MTTRETLRPSCRDSENPPDPLTEGALGAVGDAAAALGTGASTVSSTGPAVGGKRDGGILDDVSGSCVLEIDKDAGWAVEPVGLKADLPTELERNAQRVG